ncbi:MAG: septum formation initiator family protein [Parcubacteria group bacterium]|nr:septum formation initiator family protein [Parcubacteria group bacterium]
MLNRQLALTFILIFAAGFLVYLVARDYPKKMEIESQLGDVKNKIAALKKDEEKQMAMAEYLNSESYLEKQARLRLNLKKEGEEVVFIYKKDGPENINQEEDDENSFLSKLKRLFSIFMFE